MIFLSYWFFVFACGFFALYLLPLAPAIRRMILLLACLLFQAHFAGPAGMAPIVVLAAITYVCGLSGSRALITAGIAISVLALVFYKYAVFLAHDVLGLIAPGLAQEAAASARGLLPEAPPLAISFFVFEFVHYLFEVRRGAAPIRSPVNFALFAAFWPSLVAGPIKRYAQFLPSLQDGLRRVAGADLVAGMLRVTSGLLKKFAADYLGQVIDFWDDQFGQLSRHERIGIVVAIGARILLDFSGYSDMAIGFARMMGIRLPENFRWPYLATSLTQFWQRWHISLSTWIRDYVYIPLGGGRHGVPRQIANGAVAFAAVGLWHGAGWNFLLWGLYHGAGLGFSTLTLRLGRGLWPAMPPALRYAAMLVGWAGTTCFVLVGWLLFFYPVPRAWEMLRLCVTR